MEYLMILLLIFIAVLFLMQVVFFEITKSKMEKINNMNWFLSLDKPFSYNRVGYMVFLCLICYFISSPVELFTLSWFVYFVLFLAMGIVADAVVQYAIMVYSKKRCRRQIEDAHLLQNELQHFTPNTDFEKDTRIKFVGTVYDQELLKAIRINAFAYIHGHSVGGTNPSLLEAMATTNINLLLNVDFNIEVGDSTASYWGKQLNSLTDIINNVETFSNEYIQKLGNEAKQIIKQRYSWDLIINKYENLFLNKVK